MRTDEELFAMFWQLADGDPSGVESLVPEELHRLKQLVARMNSLEDQAQAKYLDSDRTCKSYELHGLPGQIVVHFRDEGDRTAWPCL